MSRLLLSSVFLCRELPLFTGFVAPIASNRDSMSRHLWYKIEKGDKV